MNTLDGLDGCPVPRLLVAVTRHTYFFVGVRPVTVIGLVLALPALVAPWSEVQVALNFVIAAPLLAGLVNLTRTEPTAALVTVGFAGGDGDPAITTADLVDCAPLPALFVADTVNRYALPVAAQQIVNEVVGADTYVQPP
jgi:hypothetical protein